MNVKRQNCVALAGIGVHESLVVLVTFSKVHVKLRSHAINLDIVSKAPDEFRSGWVSFRVNTWNWSRFTIETPELGEFE